MTYKIALNFEDGVTRFIDCKPSETVADAAYRQRINVPIDCRDGPAGPASAPANPAASALANTSRMRLARAKLNKAWY